MISAFIDFDSMGICFAIHCNYESSAKFSKVLTNSCSASIFLTTWVKGFANT